MTVDVAAQFLVWYFENVRQEDKESVPSLSDCKLILNDNPDLYATLKDAQTTQDFSELDKSDLLHKHRLNWCSHFETVRRILAGLGSTGTMPLLVNGKPWLAHGFWFPTPDVPSGPYPPTPHNEQVVEYIKSLQIPLTQVDPVPRLPDLAVHNLGSFREDPVLLNRIQNIFRDTSNTFLVNVAGSGKSRLLYEGLCIRWGLFFSAHQAPHVKPLTICDLHCLVYDCNWEAVKPLEEHDGWTRSLPQEGYTFALETNIKIAHRCFSQVLLARLLVLREFMRNVGSGRGLEKSWLEMQLHQPDERPIESLLAALQRVPVDDRIINEAIAYHLAEIFATLDIPAGERFYIVLDQAEAVTHQWYWFSHHHAFRDQARDGETYPILKEILRCWHAHVKDYPVSFVVSGREIPRQFYTGEGWESYQWTSNTGCFNGGEDQRRYLARYLSPDMAALERDKFLDQACKLLPGRYRITANFLAFMLSKGYREPCDKLLHEYVFTPWDGRWDSEDPMEHDYDPSDSRIYEPGVVSDIHYTLLHTLCFAQGPSCTNIKLITDGSARFTDANMSTIAIDEIPIISRAAYWFNLGDAGFSSAYYDKTRSLTDIEHFTQKIMPGSLRKGLEMDHHATCHIAVCIAVLFERPTRMWDLFSFPVPPPTWAQQAGWIVTRRRRTGTTAKGDTIRVSPFYFSKRTHRELITRAHSLSELAAWVEGTGKDTPLCLYPTNSGEILMFCMQVRDGRLAWVFLKVPTQFSGGEMSPSDLAQCYDSMDPEVLFADLKSDDPDIPALLRALPQKCLNTGPYGLLRVVVPFNAKIDINESGFSGNRGSVALLSTDVLQSYVKKGEVQERVMAQNVLFALTGQRPSYSDNDIFYNRVLWQRKDEPIAPQPSPAITKRKMAVNTSKKRRSATANELSGQVGDDSEPVSKRLRSRS
ncbi:hypothetical protein VNI00_014290 [Paramarasmius palmivorus]|uniref:Uncharacterized protein n=1 Tax=Paramarasmius palmivorus TaxID=297713 RepID=A0AAW0BWI2_9AGAR